MTRPGSPDAHKAVYSLRLVMPMDGGWSDCNHNHMHRGMMMMMRTHCFCCCVTHSPYYAHTNSAGSWPRGKPDGIAAMLSCAARMVESAHGGGL